MKKIQRKLASGVLLFGLPFALLPAAYAAKSIDLSHQKLSVLQSFLAAPGAATAAGSVNMVETRRNTDFNQTLHVRVQEMYSGYPVWGGDAIVHVPNSGKTAANMTVPSLVAAGKSDVTMNGVIYQDINKDLANTPGVIFTQAQADKAVKSAIEAYSQKVGGQPAVKDQQAKLMVFVDTQKKAHWTFLVSFYAEPAKAGDLPVKMNYIMDAVSFNVYVQWNDIKTIQDLVTEDSFGGGFGGNKKMGQLVYDGLTGDNHYRKLVVTRDEASKMCALDNTDVVVKNFKNNKGLSFSCDATNPDHNNVYWDDAFEKVNGGYSPGNDALFGGNVIKDLYQQWYNVPVLTKNGKPMKLVMVVHDPIDNAFWDGSKMTFGDGVSMFYPLTSLGVAAHEISHGFTEQHSGLEYYGQSGGMNEAYSDMAAQAAEYFAYNKNSWQIGPEIFKAKDEALRYMDKPSKDCKGKNPGSWCSIDNASQYYDGLDVHFSSGVFNRAFYLMGTADGWNTRYAFDAMILANQNYWTSTSSFEEGACGVLKATRDLAAKNPGSYNLDVVQKAFKAVAVDTSSCEL